MLHGSHFDCARMLIESRSHQLGKGHQYDAEMPKRFHPSRLVYGSQSRYAAMPCNQLLPPVLGSQKLIAETLCEKRSHQLGKGLQCGAAMPTFHHPSRSVLESQRRSAEMPCDNLSQGKGQGEYAGMSVVVHPSLLVRGGSRSSRSNAPVSTLSSISFMEVNNSQQRCHPDTASRGKGQQSFAEMPDIEHPSQPVYRGYSLVAERPISKRLAREGSTKACNQQCQSFTTLPTSLWANRSTQKCYAESAHQLGKDIICTLIKPLLFLPFLLIYGSHFDCAKMLIESRSHQIWAILVTPKGHNAFAQYNQRPLVFRRNAL